MGRMVLDWVIYWKKAELQWKMCRVEMVRMGMMQGRGEKGEKK